MSFHPNPKSERALEQAERMNLIDGKAIVHACDRAPTRKGVKRIRKRLNEHRAPALTRSAFERRFLIFCRKHKLPTPEMNAWVESFELDAVWRKQRLAVELDDYFTHGTKRSFEDDRKRDFKLRSLGWEVGRVTPERLKAEPADLAAELRLTLSLR
jgi:very-short-patch-repair endonuclease